MYDVVSPGESEDRSSRRFSVSGPALRRAAAACVLLLAFLAGPAAASSLYRCLGSSGETVFAGTTTGYRNCRKIGDTGPARPSRPPSPPPPVAKAEPSAVASLEGVVGSVVRAPEQGVPPPAVPVKRGWDYRESTSTDLAAGPAPEPAKGSRVLRGAVYRITRADGGVEYTNVAPGGAAKGSSIKMLFTYIATCVACDVHSKIDWSSVALNLTSYGEVIRAASSEFGVDEALLRAVIHAESAFNPRALSVAGAQGLMQLVPGTARDMGVLDAFDAQQNIRGGARYLALLLRNFNGNERLAAAAYNAGPGAVQKYNGVPPYDETQVYVERVGILRKRYGEGLRRVNVPLADRGTL